MISIVLYGRNDNYGYNLHKRAALSFNCMAELLDRNDDEILFVDYNTPNDFPTFPEAIQDTLTKTAREKLRILRLRPHVHQRFSSKTRLLALEPVARNVAIRRANPTNRWVLSTNTDMIFVPRRAASLDEIVGDLPPGFYHAPRMEIPETLWESLDRTRPCEAINTVRDWGSSLYLNEVVLGPPFALYDGPGDFQLIQRSDLFQIHGFHEAMLLGWHVDSNIARRLTLLHGKVGDLGGEIFGYHCDHARQITPAHSHSRTENDWRFFVDAVERADIPEQAESWGCANDDIEEVSLSDQSSSIYVMALKELIGPRLLTPPVVSYYGTYNETNYDPRHVLPFLADMFISSEKRTNVAWLGARSETLTLFARFWKRLGFTGQILISEALVRDCRFASVPEAAHGDLQTLMANADAFVIDFGPPADGDDDDSEKVGGLPAPLARALNQALLQVVQAEYKRIDRSKQPRPIIAVNAINNTFEASVMAAVGAALTPLSTRMRHGFVLPVPKGRMDLTSRLTVGEAGRVDGGTLRSRAEAVGTVIHGPYRYLPVGNYHFALALSGSAREDAGTSEPVAVLEIASGHNYMAHRVVTPNDLAAGQIEIDVEVSEERALEPGFSLETRLRSLEPIDLTISGLTCERLADAKRAAGSQAPVLELADWLPLLFVGPCGGRRNGRAVNRTGTAGHIFYGPYWVLPAGLYEAVFTLNLKAAASRGNPFDIVCRVEAVSGEDHLGLTVVRRGDVRERDRIRLTFAVTALQSTDPRFALELWLWDAAILPLAVKAVTVRRRGEVPEMATGLDWLNLMTIGPGGSRDKSEIVLQTGRRGLVARGPYWGLGPGRYKLAVEFRERLIVDGAGENLLALAVMSRGRFRTYHLLDAAALAESRHVLVFEVRKDETPDGRLPVELHIRSSGGVAGAIRRIGVDRIGESSLASVWIEQPTDWMPWLETGEAGRFDGGVLVNGTDRAGFLFYGPYWRVPAGLYEAVLMVNVKTAASQGNPFDIVYRLEAVTGDHHLGITTVRREDVRQRDRITLAFAVPAPQSRDPRFALEVRLWDNAILPLAIEAVSVRRRGELPDMVNGLDWLKLMTIGPAGSWDSGEIVVQMGRRGLVAHGPRWGLGQGRYELALEFREGLIVDGAGENLLVLSVMSRGRFRTYHLLDAAALAESRHVLVFEVREDETPEGRLPIELHIRSSGAVAGAIRRIGVDRIGESSLASVWIEQPTEWMPWLETGEAGRFDGGVLVNGTDREGVLFYGPYWRLPAGLYEAVLTLNVKAASSQGNPFDIVCRLEAVAGQDHLGLTVVRREDVRQRDRITLTFAITVSQSTDPRFALELRLWDNAILPLAVEAVSVRRQGELAEVRDVATGLDRPKELRRSTLAQLRSWSRLLRKFLRGVAKQAQK
jgi:hypothetical protein